ncbi:MAG TPA: cysteine dioxygenase family protein [Planctomycetota bacterium]|nr:cysteine dioxygenase family protein [Planctomycetota bacterium]
MVLKLRDRILKGPGGVSRPLAPEEMEALARSVDLKALDLSGYHRFQEECYARNTVLLNDQCELVVICWQPGQMSAIHDHGSSYCLYLVVDGTMIEERYRLRDGKPEPTGERSFGKGDITIASGESVHRINNRGEGKLVTVHIYSPPLGPNMKLYTPIPRKAKA